MAEEPHNENEDVRNDEDTKLTYSAQPLTDDELDQKYPNRPRNHSRTLPFSDLFLTLFNPLRDERKKSYGPRLSKKKLGRHGPVQLTPHEARRAIIERFIWRWKTEVGGDIFPAFRLILPEKDRERAMYGLKEKTIGKLLVHVMQIDKNSEDGFNLLNWKLPGQKFAASMAGDFAGRCFEALSKRPVRTEPGPFTISEVNDRLDRLAVAQKEEAQLPIMRDFYHNMNPEEMMWLVRMILRQMKIGATEKTILEIWHPDAETLFNVSSNLRRVCWELHDLDTRLQDDETEISLMECFQPQLAQFQLYTFDKMVQRLGPTEDDTEFWIEEKLDGERMQLHMIQDESIPGGKRFAFWSRKAKDYTYLYGNGLYDDNSAITRHLKGAFHDGVRNLILDGEMITWDTKADCIVGFGTLKTAALEHQKNPFSEKERPVLRIFDILYLNDQPLTKYTLRDRRKALEQVLKPVHRRLEIHPHTKAYSAAEIEPALRKVVAESSEGLVLKNPRSMYHLNERNDDWIKVKPEYMTEFGEDLDCLVIGGYYGSGHRGGGLSSFLCGLRVDSYQTIKYGADKRKFYSFFKVGGGFTAADYQRMRHETDGKWQEWDPKHPPTHLIELAGGDKQYERPDVWILPEESVVVSVKAASVNKTESFRVGQTLRFPRFKSLRTDKNWQSALSISEFDALKKHADKEKDEKQFRLDEQRRKRPRNTKREMIVAGTEELIDTSHELESSTGVFEGLSFYIMSESKGSEKKSKAELTNLVKHHGGRMFQSEKANAGHVICIADRDLVPVSALKRRKTHSIIRPEWLFDCIHQAQQDKSLGRTSLLLPYEPRHVYFALDEDSDLLNLGVDAVTGGIGIAADRYGDSFARDVTSTEALRGLFNSMPSKTDEVFDKDEFISELLAHGLQVRDGLDGLFADCVVYFDKTAGSQPNGMDLDDEPFSTNSNQNPQLFSEDIQISLAEGIIEFGGGTVSSDLDDITVTHVVVPSDTRTKARALRDRISKKSPMPRLVTLAWIQESWAEKTRLDEERFAP